MSQNAKLMRLIIWGECFIYYQVAVIIRDLLCDFLYFMSNNKLIALILNSIFISFDCAFMLRSVVQGMTILSQDIVKECQSDLECG